MNQHKRYLLSVALLSLLCVSAASVATAQTDAQAPQLESSYELSLQVVIGSNEAGGADQLPPSLSGLSRQLRNNFSFTNYRLANTFLGRISNTGNIEYKSVANILGQEATGELPSFLEWSLTDFRVVPRGFRARMFRFGARVPITIATFRNSSTDTATPVTNYENVGLTVNMIGLPSNAPTLVGTISLPKTKGTVFLVATVRPADM